MQDAFGQMRKGGEEQIRWGLPIQMLQAVKRRDEIWVAKMSRRRPARVQESGRSRIQREPY